MSVKVVFLILGIIFYVVKQLSKSGKDKSPQGQKTKRKPVARTASKQPKSIDDIFNEFVKEVESANKKSTQKAKPIVKPAVAKSKSRTNTLDWQQVDKTQIKEKKQLIDHEDYHGISHRIDKSHQIEDLDAINSTEGKVFEFDVQQVNWMDAIITKEVLDRKYT